MTNHVEIAKLRKQFGEGKLDFISYHFKLLQHYNK